MKQTKQVLNLLSKRKQKEANEAVNVIVTVNVTVTVNVNVYLDRIYTQSKMKDTKVSFFSWFGSDPYDSNLFWCLTTDLYKKKVEAIRSLTDIEVMTKKKKQLPGFTPSGVFFERKARGLDQHSGYICLDIDSKDNPDIKDWQKFLFDVGSRYNFISYAGLSVSGKGAFLIIPIKHPDRHTQHFDALVNELSPDIKVDKSGRDVSRYRYVSYNKAPYINYEAATYTKFIEPITATRKEYIDVDRGTQLLYDKIMNRGVNITHFYKDWLSLACSFRNVPNGREMFHDISSMDARYSREETDKLFDSVSGGRHTIATFFWIAKNYDITLKS